MNIVKFESLHCLKAGFLGATLTILVACGSMPSSDSATLSERDINKAVVTRFMDNRLQMTSDEVADEFLADNYQEIRNEFENLVYNIQGSALANQAQPIDQAISNRRDTLDLVVGEGSSVAVRYIIKGSHSGNLYGIPATGKDFEIYSVAVFQLTDGKITEGWYMTDEVELLRQLGTAMPAREDGRYNIPPTGGEHAVSSDAILQFMLANPADTREYRNKLKIAARKANNPPPGIIDEADGRRPYDNFLRPGFKHIVELGGVNGDASQGFGGGYPDRDDLMDYFLIDGDTIMIRFRLTGTNTVSLYGLPPSNAPMDSWEVAFMTFVDEHWRDAWWIGDDQSMLMQLGWPQSFWFPEQP
jgi:predicted ester cyclase